MKPKPFSELNHFTVPCAMRILLACWARTLRGPAGPEDPHRHLTDVDPRHQLVPAGVQDTTTETERPVPRTLLTPLPPPSADPGSVPQVPPEGGGFRSPQSG